MSQYTIEDGIPIPPPRSSPGPRRSGPRTELARVLDCLRVGQSVLLNEYREYLSAMNFVERARPKAFAFRKADGWRVWRIE